MSTRRLALLAAVLVAVTLGCWSFEGAPRAAIAGPAHGDHTDELTPTSHPEVGVVARTLRTPSPSASVGVACGALAALALTLSASRRAPLPYRRTPLYTLLRVYRL